MITVKLEKLKMAIARFRLYLTVADAAKSIKPNDIKALQKKSEELLAGLASNKVGLEEGMTTYNEMIKKTNALLPTPTYPELDNRSIHDLLRSDIVAFENFVNLEMNAGHLEVNDEIDMFNRAVGIWQDVGKDPAAESIVRFSKLVQKANTLLPKELHYPVPDPKEY